MDENLKINTIKEIENSLKLDINRENRTGIPEVVYGKNKKFKDIVLALTYLVNKNNKSLGTKLKNKHISKFKDNIEHIIKKYNLNNIDIIINENSNCIMFKKKNYNIKSIGKVGILCGGTSDIPIAEECKITCEYLGLSTITHYDVGVAGIHRLFKPLKEMINENVCCIIVIAGMEGALPSVVAGLVDIPVVGVPVSVGYGVSENGFCALNTMLSSCSPGIAVVNIDNGFGASCFAYLIAKKINDNNTNKNNKE